MGQKKQIDRYQVSCFQEIFVDLFAGGGGASMGIEQALCLPIFAAVNHDPDAIAQHAANHRWTKPVPCEECRHYDSFCGVCQYLGGEHMSLSDFCSYGERREKK